MKVLLINNHHKITGGTERYYLDLYRLLTNNSHKVAQFSMVSKSNAPSKWSKYFVSNIDLSQNSVRNFFRKVFRMSFSFESRKKIKLLLDDFMPDIVHINNIYYYISPSILLEIKKRGIPIIQTVHDYQLISPNTTLFFDGKPCEVTKKTNYYKALLYRLRQPYMATIMSVITAYIQNFFHFYENNIDYFVTPSKFMGRKLKEYGFKAKNIVHIPNFTYFKFKKGMKHTLALNKFILFYGRIDEAKGIFFLLNVANALPDIKFKLIGKYVDRDIEQKVKKYLHANKLTNVDIQDHLETNKLRKMISKSYFVIIPSLWYENQPYSILESLALGKVVLGSRIGGIPEVIKEGINGSLFIPGNINDCCKKISFLWNNTKAVIKMEKNIARNNEFSPENHYKKLISIYRQAILNKNYAN